MTIDWSLLTLIATAILVLVMGIVAIILFADNEDNNNDGGN